MMMMMSETNRASTDSETAPKENKEDGMILPPPLDSPAGAGLAREGITPQEWTALLEAGEVASLKQGQLLMSQGDIYQQPGDREVYLLLSGECRIEVQGKPVGRIATGDFVGEGEKIARETSAHMLRKLAAAAAAEVPDTTLIECVLSAFFCRRLG